MLKIFRPPLCDVLLSLDRSRGETKIQWNHVIRNFNVCIIPDFCNEFSTNQLNAISAGGSKQGQDPQRFMCSRAGACGPTGTSRLFSQSPARSCSFNGYHTLPTFDQKPSSDFKTHWNILIATCPYKSELDNHHWKKDQKTHEEILSFESSWVFNDEILW